MTRIEVTIDRLVLHGLSEEVGRDVGSLVRVRLAELAAGGAVEASEPVSTAPPSESRRIADEVARNVWGTIARERRAEG